MTRRPPRILALGNPDRGDDGAGPAVADRLEGLAGERIDLRRLPGEATEILAAWEGVDRVVVIDAVRTSAAAGTIHRINLLETLHLPAPAVPSSHGLGLGHALALGRALGRLPARLALFGVEAGSVEAGAGLSPAVAAAAARLADELARELARERVSRPGGRTSRTSGEVCKEAE